MNTSLSSRLFTEMDAERIDESGFLDLSRTPRVVRFETILREPLAWIIGPPWLGKTTVAQDVYGALRFQDPDSPLAALCSLTTLGAPNADATVPPEWWADWKRNPAAEAVWLIDGVDEGCDRNRHLFNRILQVIGATPTDHLKQLRLILFSRPYADASDFRDALNRTYPGICGRYEPCQFWLARLDREAAERMVGAERFPAVLEMIQQNKLETVSGYPVVLHFLAAHSATGGRLTKAQVWRGIIKTQPSAATKLGCRPSSYCIVKEPCGPRWPPGDLQRVLLGIR
ncbi:MAG TPA: hypothetical protein VFE62_02530 [Gemmataceae bacterium]|nr:hypothetical protein [Gemmataceae bacterium]